MTYKNCKAQMWSKLKCNIFKEVTICKMTYFDLHLKNTILQISQEVGCYIQVSLIIMDSLAQ